MESRADINTSLRGQLLKKSRGAWKSSDARMFALDEGGKALMEYDAADKECRAPIAMLKCGETPPTLKALSPQQAQRTNAFSVTVGPETWVLAAPSPRARDTWMWAIKEAGGGKPSKQNGEQFDAVLAHGAICGLFFSVSVIRFGFSWNALFAALLLALHPANCDTAASLVGRAIILCAELSFCALQPGHGGVGITADANEDNGNADHGNDNDGHGDEAAFFDEVSFPSPRCAPIP